ncbi:MAG TPA: maleylpyruvate isomerase family mycothiol-dependent enzyme [Propionibacteriaceae bacterium]
MDLAGPLQELTPQAEVDVLTSLATAATRRLLQDTGTVNCDDWRRPSRLPGWTRGHVATHLARQAEALVRVVEGALTGRPQPMYASAEQRDSEIEAGAGRSGEQLRTDLDSAAAALSAAFDRLAEADAWERALELRGGDQVPARLLPLARMSEVVLHHVDLDIGFEVADIDTRDAELLLSWCALRLRRRSDFPRLQLVLPSGVQQAVGSLGAATTVSGAAPELLGWLTGRSSSSGPAGSPTLSLPSFG